MDIYLTEEEQVKKIRDWLSQYGLTIALGIILAFAATLGWRYWQNHQEKMASQASASYEEMVVNFMNEDLDKARLEADYIKHQYPNTPYAMLAAFVLAKQAVQDNNLSEAEKQLRWVIDNTHSDSLKQIATVRIARVLNAEHKPKQALDILHTITREPYLAAALMIKGDAWLALGDKIAAKGAYRQALDNIPDTDSIRPFIQMKLAELAVAQQLDKLPPTPAPITAQKEE